MLIHRAYRPMTGLTNTTDISPPGVYTKPIFSPKRNKRTRMTTPITMPKIRSPRLTGSADASCGKSVGSQDSSFSLGRTSNHCRMANTITSIPRAAGMLPSSPDSAHSGRKGSSAMMVLIPRANNCAPTTAAKTNPATKRKRG